MTRKSHGARRTNQQRVLPPPVTKLPPVPKRIRFPGIPGTALPPTLGHWLWTCREGFEDCLFEELAWNKAVAKPLGACLVESAELPKQPSAFARMGFRVSDICENAEQLVERIGTAPLHLQVWVPDSEKLNRFQSVATDLQQKCQTLLADRGVQLFDTPWKAFEHNGRLVQVCVLGSSQLVLGEVPARDAVSLAPGGRARMKRQADAPSRASMKLDEALEWYGVSPGRGEVCADLGSAPGGWTRRLVERGARVVSVDPGKLAEDLAKSSKVKHYFQSAFQFEPEEPVDWLFCDMAWRPLEVAQLLSKWGRKKWATHLVANIKLPMKDKLPMVWAARHTLENGGWKHVRIRQLYHDRDEVTVSARSH